MPADPTARNPKKGSGFLMRARRSVFITPLGAVRYRYPAVIVMKKPHPEHVILSQ